VSVALQFWAAMLDLGGIASLATLRPTTLAGFRTAYTLLVMATLLVVHWKLREQDLETAAVRWSWPVRGLSLAAMLFSLTTMAGEDRAFIYFQF
jgi:hypothetical protein